MQKGRALAAIFTERNIVQDILERRKVLVGGKFSVFRPQIIEVAKINTQLKSLSLRHDVIKNSHKAKLNSS